MSFKKLIFNPFERYAGLQAAVFGLAVALLAAVLASMFQTRFDGVIDAHFVPAEVSLQVALLDQAVNVVSLFVVFYLAALIAGARHTRPIDILGTMMLARTPYLIVPFFNIGGGFSRIGQELTDSLSTNPSNPDLGALLFIIPLSILMLLLLVWLVTLFFNAFKVSTHLKGSRLILTFVLGLLCAEALSIFLLQLLKS